MMEKLINNSRKEAIGIATAAPGDPRPDLGFEFKLSKDAQSVGYESATSDAYTILDLRMDVRPLKITQPCAGRGLRVPPQHCRLPDAQPDARHRAEDRGDGRGLPGIHRHHQPLRARHRFSHLRRHAQRAGRNPAFGPATGGKAAQLDRPPQGRGVPRRGQHRVRARQSGHHAGRPDATGAGRGGAPDPQGKYGLRAGTGPVVQLRVAAGATPSALLQACRGDGRHGRQRDSGRAPGPHRPRRRAGGAVLPALCVGHHAAGAVRPQQQCLRSGNHRRAVGADGAAVRPCAVCQQRAWRAGRQLRGGGGGDRGAGGHADGVQQSQRQEGGAAQRGDRGVRRQPRCLAELLNIDPVCVPAIDQGRSKRYKVGSS
ncbi:conserved hypothetical protein [Ricinus communis]|uniref:Uncharacterized protein n=1 Tax=Ricinus communis TaxID=3988 RepID=B9TC40_RICCO|nr:conserved hypothetical protein [Ricinus communis]